MVYQSPTNTVPFAAGTYVESFYYWSANTGPTFNVNLDYGLVQSASTVLSVPSKTWTRVQLPIVAPSPFYQIYVGLSGLVNVGMFFTNLQFEPGSTASPYWDGNYTFANSGIYRNAQPTWMGGIGQSASVRAVQTASTGVYSYVTFADVNSQGTAYGNGTALPIFDLVMSYNSEQLYNQVNITNNVGGTVTATNPASTALYGLRSYTVANLSSNNTRLQNIANDLDGQYSKPEYRAESITLALEALTPAQQAILLDPTKIDIRQLVRVCFQPSRLGPVIDKIYQVLKVDHDIQIETHHVTLMLGSLDNLPARADSTLFAVTNQAIAS